MKIHMSRVWLAVAVPAVLAAILGASAVMAAGNGGNDSRGAIQLQQPTQTPSPEATPGQGGSDGTSPDKNCPHDHQNGGNGPDQSNSSTSVSGVSFRRHG